MTLTPSPEVDSAAGIALGQYRLEKQWHGDFEGSSRGQMLTGAMESNSAAVYVALERVTGTLEGRKGSFLLMHNGTMTRDGQHLSITVAPGSGTGELVGLSGTLGIQIVEHKHLYDFEYTLPRSQ